MPNISIFSPCDDFEINQLVPATFIEISKYFRIDKSYCENLPQSSLTLGVPRLISESSSRIALLATGIVSEAMKLLTCSNHTTWLPLFIQCILLNLLMNLLWNLFLLPMMPSLL